VHHRRGATGWDYNHRAARHLAIGTMLLRQAEVDMKQQRGIVGAIVHAIGLCVGTSMAASVGAQPGVSCTGATHCVDVTIVGGAIQSVPAVVVAAKNHQIYWRIQTAGYSFPPPPPPPTGIAFKPASSINDNGHMPANEFPCNRMSATLFHCNDANSTHDKGVRSYQYSITVIDASGHRIVSDPWIVNR